jgi:hypothetical protein
MAMEEGNAPRPAGVMALPEEKATGMPEIRALLTEI